MGTSAVRVEAGDVSAHSNEEGVNLPFGIVLRDHLLSHGFATGIGNPNWSAFADTVDGVHYETLRKAVAGERPPGVGLMEAVADAMGVQPSVFFEYRLLKAQEQFDPKDVGVEQALKNLELWAAAQDSGKRRR